MTFDQFQKLLYYDIVQTKGQTMVIATFEEAFSKNYSNDVVEAHNGICKKQVAKDLYDYLTTEFGHGRTG